MWSELTEELYLVDIAGQAVIGTARRTVVINGSSCRIR